MPEAYICVAHRTFPLWRSSIMRHESEAVSSTSLNGQHFDSGCYVLVLFFCFKRVTFRYRRDISRSLTNGKMVSFDGRLVVFNIVESIIWERMYFVNQFFSDLYEENQKYFLFILKYYINDCNNFDYHVNILENLKNIEIFNMYANKLWCKRIFRIKINIIFGSYVHILRT